MNVRRFRRSFTGILDGFFGKVKRKPREMDKKLEEHCLRTDLEFAIESFKRHKIETEFNISQAILNGHPNGSELQRLLVKLRKIHVRIERSISQGF